MELFAAPEETIAGASLAIRSGRRSCREVLESCLTRLDAREGEVRAWALMGIAVFLGQRYGVQDTKTPLGPVVDAAIDLIAHGMMV